MKTEQDGRLTGTAQAAVCPLHVHPAAPATAAAAASSSLFQLSEAAHY